MPLLIQAYGGDPAVIGAVGMLAGFCGTLMTPMAANFNLVPAALAGAEGPVWRDPGADPDRAPLARREHPDPVFRRPSDESFSLDADTAARFARIALGHVRQEYPHKLDHVLGSDEDALPAHVLHPIFFGSFDWHSCVHGWWTLLTLRRLFPVTDEARAIAKLADLSFTAEKVGGELDYLRAAAEPRVRAAVRLGLAAAASPRSLAAQARWLGGGAGAAGARLRRAASRLS